MPDFTNARFQLVWNPWLVQGAPFELTKIDVDVFCLPSTHAISATVHYEHLGTTVVNRAYFGVNLMWPMSEVEAITNAWILSGKAVDLRRDLFLRTSTDAFVLATTDTGIFSGAYIEALNTSFALTGRNYSPPCQISDVLNQ